MLQDYTRPTETVQLKMAWSPHGRKIPILSAGGLTAVRSHQPAEGAIPMLEAGD